MKPHTPDEILSVWLCGYSGRDDATPTAHETKANGDSGTDQKILDKALAIVKAFGFRVSKPKIPQRKNSVGPTFEARFSDGAITRMSTFTSLKTLDWRRGVRLSQAAYMSRFKGRAVPPIITGHFEQHGVVLATYERPEIAPGLRTRARAR